MRGTGDAVLRGVNAKQSPQERDLDRNPVILVSACLMGKPCRYNGTHCHNGAIESLARKYTLLSVCPEVMGGLRTPRQPCELRDGRVFTRDGQDVTGAFEAGCGKALALAREHGVTLAILKEKSPSCGTRQVYDGSFRDRLVPGSGMMTGLLRENGVEVISNEDVFEIDALGRREVE